MSRIFKISSIVLVVLLFTVGSIPATGEQFPGATHWLVHLLFYAGVALSFGLGWPLLPTPSVALIVGAVGLVHEVTEIVSHGHPFEGRDAIINFVGAVAGSAVVALYERWQVHHGARG
jgi:hypothetical protein